MVYDLRTMVYYDFIGDPFQTTSSFEGGGGSFNTQGIKPAQNSYDIGMDITYLGNNHTAIKASYDFEFKEDFRSHSGFVRLRYEW